LNPASPSPPVPGLPLDSEVWQLPDARAWHPRPKFQDRIWVHWLLFFLTILTTTWAGLDFHLSFTQEFLRGPITLGWGLVLHGLWFSIPLLAILTSHEMGHYVACRYYGVDASRPFFIPMPIVMSGTLGAFIRIREPFPSKRALFDIGIAGPIAGFVVAVPLLLAGMLLSNVTVEITPQNAPATVSAIYHLGEPLLFKGLAWIIWGIPPAGYELNWHPMLMAAWFGMLITALNLFPVGQLDGGHISYAVLGRKSSQVTIVMIGILTMLIYVSSSWIAWTVLLIAMLYFFGRHHPRTYDEDVALDSRRVALAIFAIVIFVLCFTPNPLPFQVILR
jgi:membrane-associated protease RseP (regulator of RpoE activity)